MAGAQDDEGSGVPPTPRELRAARRRAHEIERERRKKQGGKSDKMGKGRQQPDDEHRHRR